MYIIFYGVGQYKLISNKGEALKFCKEVGVTWIDC